MAIYRVRNTLLEAARETSFQSVGLSERRDLQRLLRDQIEVIAKNTLVIAEEFGDWEDSRRRIDLLAIDEDANIVVIELKRTDDAGHAELQSIRYAAMVSTLTFGKVVEIYGEYLKSRGRADDPQQSLLDFLDWTVVDEDSFAREVRIIVAAPSFSKELTSAVMWLNEHDVDIRCVRMKPYQLDGDVFIDVQQLIPLPEATEYQVQIREKARQERISREDHRDYTKYDLTIRGSVISRLAKRNVMFEVVRHVIQMGRSPEAVDKIVERPNLFRSFDGQLNALTFRSKLPAKQLRRWFCESDDQLFIHGGNTFALTNQWSGPDVLDAVNKLRAAFPDAAIDIRESDA